MRSSSGAYLSNLDHLRAFAAFQVFVWHFVHHASLCESLCFSRDYFFVGPFMSILEEGHTGVSLFMCISGYVFAKLTDGHRINTLLFWLNRAIRLIPLLVAWSFITVLSAVMTGVLSWGDLSRAMTPLWLLQALLIAPGGWSIVIEMQFYLLFPFLLVIALRYGNRWLVFIVVMMVLARGIYWLSYGSVQDLAYATLAGRIDQLLIGYCAYHFAARGLEGSPSRRRSILLWCAVAVIALLIAYDRFNYEGGYYGLGGHPSKSAIWIFWPLLEAVGYSALIVAYLRIRLPAAIDAALANAGTWSYSIYLSQFHLVPLLFFLIDSLFGMPVSFAGRFIWALIAFPIVVGVSAITYKTIERPFLALRRNYLISNGVADFPRSPEKVAG
jgi:peptidoglycan/LPS O-acetylase OafA/YrhL